MPARPRPTDELAANPWRWLAGSALSVVLSGWLVVVSIGPAAPMARAQPQPSERSGPFAWLVAVPAPPNWARAVLPSGGAQLSYPPSFAPLAGDAGTVSAAVRDTRGKFLAYVNATPRQGDERLKGFGAFRVGLLRHEDPAVIEEAAKDGLAFGGGHGSCVIDHYVTRIDHNRYREVACLLQGRHASAVVAAAATDATWPQFEPVLRQVIASFAVR